MQSSNELLYAMEKSIRSHFIDFIIKRIFDIIISIILFIILLPALIIIAAAIRLDSKGHAIFTQKRVGLRGRIFTIYKFRTMVKNAEELFELNIDKEDIGSLVFQDKNDSRVTRVGSFLRKTSLDELPQLINVLIGNMSLVGPRPEIPDVTCHYNDMQKLRLLFKPGITGLAQVSGRGEIELERTIEYDIQYIKSFSIWLDLKILFKTFLVVFKSEGAY